MITGQLDYYKYHPRRHIKMKMKVPNIHMHYLRVVSILILAVFIAGCGSKEEKMEKHLAKAKAYVASNEYKKAVIEYKNVLQLEPKNDAAYYELGEVYLKLKEVQEAFQSFSRAISIKPENLQAQMKMGQLLLLGRFTGLWRVACRAASRARSVAKRRLPATSARAPRRSIAG